LIPAGTGGQMAKHQLEADERDQKLIEEREHREAAALPAPDQTAGGGEPAAAE